MRTSIVILAIVLSFFSCEKKGLSNTSTDFTAAFIFTDGIEGPAVDSEGNLYAVNFKTQGTIGKIDSTGNASIFITLDSTSIGNGIRFNKNDDMFIADYTNHNILKVSNGEQVATVYASDSTMNQPNDLAIAPNETLYASDPNWEANTGNLWMIKNKKISLLEANMGTTNGIEVSPDGKTLYVNESVQLKIWKYDINADDTLSNKRVFVSFQDFGLDGMRCDNKGNLYVCRYGKGEVVVLSPTGNLIRTINLKGKNPTNITFGGTNRTQCFVTVADRGCIETFIADNPGRHYIN